jgi:ribosomal protein S18 acetylase RimI-like enzyme
MNNKNQFSLVQFMSSDFENNVYFDCIDDSVQHFGMIKSALMTLDFRLQTIFFSIRNEFRDMVFELQRELNLQMHEDTNTVCLHAPMEAALQLECEIPPNFEIRELTSDHVGFINANWPHKYEQSELFIDYSIKYHVSAGLFDNDNNLLAWCLRYDNGSLGVLQVDEKHLRKGYGELVTRAILKKISESFHCDVISLVVYENEKSINLFKKLGFRALGGHTWFGFQK